MTPLDDFSLNTNKILSDSFLIKLAGIAAIFVVTLIIINLIKKLIETKVEDTKLRYKSKKMLGTIFVFLFCIFLLVVFYDKIGELSIVFGLTGAGLAFAMQDIVMSIAAWVSILFGKIYKTGDRIEISNIRGDVIDISVLKTTLMECGAWVNGDLYSGRIIKISNSNIFKEAVFNYSSDFPFLWDEINIPIKHGSNITKTQTLINEIADTELLGYAEEAQKSWNKVLKKYLIEKAQVKPLLSMTANESFMTFTLRYVVAYNQRRVTRSRLFEAILEKIAECPEEVRIASTAVDINYVAPIRVEG